MVLTLVEHLHVVAGQSPRAGVPVLATAAVYVAVAGAGLLAAPTLTGLRVPPRTRRWLVTGILTAFVGLADALAAKGQLSAVVDLAGGLTNKVVILIHLVAAAIWVGGVAHLAVFGTTRSGRAQLGEAVRRFSKYAVGATLGLVGTGVLLLLVHHIGLDDLVSSTFGNLVVVKTALLALAAALGLAHRTGWPWPAIAARRELLRVEAGVLASVLAFAALLTETALPQQALAFAGPGIAAVSLGGGQSVDLFVVRDGGTAVVRLLSDWPVQLIDQTTGVPQQLAPGQSTHVHLRSGVAALQLTSGDDERTVDVAAAVPVAGESLDYQLGRAIALGGGGHPTSVACGDPNLGADGFAFARALRARNTDALAVVTDASPASSELLDGLTQGGVRFDQHARSVLVATSAPRASAVLTRLASRPSIESVYLAPWLLDSRVLSVLSTLQLPPITVATTADVMSPLADRYRAALSFVADGVGPSVDGLRGYESVAAPRLPQRSLALYAAAPIGFLPGVLDVGHDHGAQGGWFSSGTLVPVTEKPINLGVKCLSRIALPGRAGLA